MTRPHTCGAEGGAISLWARVTKCHAGGIVKTRSTHGGEGVVIQCRLSLLE